jgi:predicted RND superfamily exporter protein
MGVGTMDAERLEAYAARAAPGFGKAAVPILAVAVLLTLVLAGALVTDPPEFNTDLDLFAPQSDAIDAHDRIHEHFPSERRPMFVHVVADDGSNVLSLDHLKAMKEDQDSLVASASASHVVAWATAVTALDVALEEQTNGTTLADVDDWATLLDLVLEEGTTCSLNQEDALLAAATFASSAMLHSDLDIGPVCAWLSDGAGVPVPTTSSTLWVLDINPDLPISEREAVQDALRSTLAEISEGSSLTYSAVSLDLISNDIDDATFDGLTMLIGLALLVVVVVLAFAFRSVTAVGFPLAGLSVALIWTYGVLNLFGAKFTALEVAVAPLVLGLGIDYSIHLQRVYLSIREDHESPAEAWLIACGKLSTPLLLAVVTTVAAFLANAVSPLPPIATFGVALALGVVCAFLASTLVVGALHVVVDARGKRSSAVVLRMPRFSERLVDVQHGQRLTILIVAVLVSLSSLVGALSLETEFDLADFLDDDLPVMQVRADIDTSYEAAGWKVVYLLMEPVDDASAIPIDSRMVDELRFLHNDLKSDSAVVGTDGALRAPSYDGPYTVLRDAMLEDAGFGGRHGLELYNGEVYAIDDAAGQDFAPAFIDLAGNASVADPLTGRTWADRVEATVALEGGAVTHLRNEVRVEASTSAESRRVVLGFNELVDGPDGSSGLNDDFEDHAVVYVTGDLVVLETVLENLSVSQLKSTAISLGVSFLVLLLLTRRLVPALVVLSPVAFSTLWVVGSMVLLGLKWNVLTVMVTALTLGIGIDFSIHMWQRMEVERERLGDRRSAMRSTMSTTGVALVMSAATTSLGFLVLLASPMPLIRDFGLITAVTVGFSLLLSLVLLPVLADLADEATGRNAQD